MTQDNRFAKARNPLLTSDRDFLRTNTYSVVQPGISAVYKKSSAEFFGSVYRGFIAPSKYFAFLVERDGVLVNPLTPEELSNVRPEISINSELGIRGEFWKDIIQGQVAFFNNRIQNFYLAGWNEFFEKLGKINIQGLETALRINMLPKNTSHQLSLMANITLLRSRVMSGRLVDRHLFTLVKHTNNTKEEFVTKVNLLPQGYTVYATDNNGNEVVLPAPISVSDLDHITKTEYHFGKDGIRDGVSPYSPEFSYNLTANYQFKKFHAGVTLNYVSDQYAEFANFENESGDGGIGKIPAFHTFDINLMYEMPLSDKIKGSFFLSGKNLGNQIFVASRLNRGQSGIMPGGFRQINAGITFDF
jgi:Fe(3+) dicitrate transport protein